MGNGCGVSIAEIDDGSGRWRVRWREVVDDGGGSKVRKQRERVVHSHNAAVELQGKVLRRLEAGEVFEEQVRVIPQVASFDAACKGWLLHKAARGVAEGTRAKYAQNIARFFATVRKLRKIDPKAPVPIDIVSRELFAEVLLAWRADGLSESTVYNTSRAILEAWTWASDDPATYRGVLPAPRDKSTVLPQAPIYVAPPAPRLAEVDAVIRRLSTYAYVAKGAAIVMRYTGLRISQALALERADLDVGAMLLTIRLGKTRRERATVRSIPVARSMLDELAPFMGPPNGSLIRRRRDFNAEPNRNHHPTAALTAAWEAATVAGECRREVWAPSNRELARPDHAFRAALQGHLVAAGVRDEVIDAIVGHAGRTTRSKHYAGPDALAKAMREAVDALPPIDWRGPAAEGDNVVELRIG